MTTPPPYTVAAAAVAAPRPGPANPKAPAGEASTTPAEPEPRASSLYDITAATQRRVVEDVVDKMRRQMVKELGGMERRLVARVEAQERMLKEGRGKEVMDED
ncbi:hypothetical protein VE01_07828 [Pseudogymnoascus verrucosus]|uniref:Uncharacterized protein n=1 Tax=Pseudogymnoascus verrucosus TaxID=342668 RepID=A0A1B8GEG6_9PEZI|nr:uncharacterized protein VE01_07828 [Pseudogymnoascus verrucosus]OBT94218.1 hypothetical protein VE01_07828 [Pseudogymnoascus verrucosus]